MVPELRKSISKTIDSKSWELERTLRTGTNAAVNTGHNQAYREATELLPDLKRQGSEHLGLAAKTGGRRENHPFSKFLHGAVTELNGPWEIHIVQIAAKKGLQVPRLPLPVMFWPHQGGGVYLGKRYPAHLWERGRELPYREAWERRKGTMTTVTQAPPPPLPSPEEQRRPGTPRPNPPPAGRGQTGPRDLSPNRLEQLNLALGGNLFVEDADDMRVRTHLSDLARVPGSLLKRLTESGLKGVHISASPITTRPGFKHLAGSNPYGRSKGRAWDEMAGGWNDGLIALSNLPGEGPSAALHEAGHAAYDLLGWSADPRIREALAPLAQGHPRLGDLPLDDAIHELFATGFEHYFKLGRRQAAKVLNQPFVDFMDEMIQARSDG